MAESQTAGSTNPFGDPAEHAEAFDRNATSWKAAQRRNTEGSTTQGQKGS